MQLSVDQAALFLDLDGTLAALAPRPEDIGPDPVRRAVLAHAQQALKGRVAIISGRSIADLDRILEEEVGSLSGVHGLERRAHGVVMRQALPESFERARAAVAQFSRKHEGLQLGDKQLRVAVSFREERALTSAVTAALENIAAAHGLTTQHGHMVCELRPAGHNKGDALEAFMNETPFLGARPIFVGDDITDEDAFARAAALGGAGVLVGSPRATKARWRLEHPRAVLQWIDDSVNAGAFNLEETA